MALALAWTTGSNGLAQDTSKSDPAQATNFLFQAVVGNDLAAIKESVAKGADIHARNARGVTPAELAVDLGHLDAANYLLALDNGRKPEVPPAPPEPAKKTAESERGKAKAAVKKTAEKKAAARETAKPLSKPIGEPRTAPATLPQVAESSDPYTRFFAPLTRSVDAGTPAAVAPPASETPLPPASETRAAAPAATAPVEGGDPALPIIGRIRGPDDPAPDPVPAPAPTATATPPTSEEPDALGRFFRAFASRLKSEDRPPGERSAATPAPAEPSGGPASRLVQRMTGLADSSGDKKPAPPAPPPPPMARPEPPSAMAPPETKEAAPPAAPATTPAPEPASPATLAASAPIPAETVSEPAPVDAGLPFPTIPAEAGAIPPAAPPPAAPAEAPPQTPAPLAKKAPTPTVEKPPPETAAGSVGRFFKRLSDLTSFDRGREQAKPPTAASDKKPPAKATAEPPPERTAVLTPPPLAQEPAPAPKAAPAPEPKAAPQARPPRKEDSRLPPPQRQPEGPPKNFFQLLADWMQRDRRDEAAKPVKPIPREMLAPEERPASPPAPGPADVAALGDKDSWTPTVERGPVAPTTTAEAPTADTATAPSQSGETVPPAAVTTGDVPTLFGLPAPPSEASTAEAKPDVPGIGDAAATLFGLPAPPGTESQPPATAEAKTPGQSPFGLFGLPGPGEQQTAPLASAPPTGGLFGTPGPSDAPDDEDAKKQWAVKNVETAQARPQVTPPAAPEPAEVSPASGFALGRFLTLGKAPPPRVEDIKSRGCLDKLSGAIIFCVEATVSPKAVEDHFRVNTVLYTGFQAIVRYDNGTATRLQTMFPSDRYDKIVGYFTGLYGSPHENWTRTIAPLASARQNNPTRAWRARHPTTGQVMVLEIRQYDDTRGGFPDTKRGVVMVYVADAQPIFPQVSSLELMRLKRVR